MGNGTGGESIWNKKFKDDKGGLKLKFDRRGLVGMCNTGKVMYAWTVCGRPL